MKTFRARVTGVDPPTLQIGRRRVPAHRMILTRENRREEQIRGLFWTREMITEDRDLTLPEVLATCDTVEEIEDTLKDAGIDWRGHVPYIAVAAGFLIGFTFWVALVISGATVP